MPEFKVGQLVFLDGKIEGYIQASYPDDVVPYYWVRTPPLDVKLPNGYTTCTGNEVNFKDADGRLLDRAFDIGDGIFLKKRKFTSFGIIESVQRSCGDTTLYRIRCSDGDFAYANKEEINLIEVRNDEKT